MSSQRQLAKQARTSFLLQLWSAMMRVQDPRNGGPLQLPPTLGRSEATERIGTALPTMSQRSRRLMVCRSLPRSHRQKSSPTASLEVVPTVRNQFPVDGNRPFIGRVRIGADNRYPRIEESPHSRPDKRCPGVQPRSFRVSYV